MIWTVEGAMSQMHFFFFFLSSFFFLFILFQKKKQKKQSHENVKPALIASQRSVGGVH